MKYKVIVTKESSKEIQKLLVERGFVYSDNISKIHSDDITLLGVDFNEKLIAEFEDESDFDSDPTWYELPRSKMLEHIMDIQPLRTLNRPSVLTDIDWEAVKTSAVNYIQEVETANDIEIGCDLERYIFEGVITAVYGKKIWDYINGIIS